MARSRKNKNGVFSFWSWLKQALDPSKLTQQPLDKQRQWLGVSGSEHLFTLQMRGVRNVLDADAIWDKQYGGQQGITTEVDGQLRTTCLYEALQDHPRIVPEADKLDQQRLDYAPRTFTDVVVWIAERQWRNEACQGGHKFAVMVNRLAFAHRRDFKHLLYPERGPQYCVMPDAQLADDEVVCQFGLSVFIPAQGDELIAELLLRKQGQAAALPEWVFYEQGKQIRRAFGLYRGQQYLQLSMERQHSCIQPPLWFQHGQGSLQLSLAAEAGNTSGLLYQQRQQFADGQYVQEAASPELGAEGRVVCAYFAVDDGNERLDVEVIPVDAVQASMPVDEDDASTILAGLTIFAPPVQMESQLQPYQLRLLGFALPRLDSVAAQLGGWALCLDAKGKVLNTATSACSGLRLVARRGDPQLTWQLADGAPTLITQLPVALEWQGFSLQASPLADEYYALLHLPEAQTWALYEQSYSVGRPDGQAEGRLHLSLDALDQPATLLDQQGKGFARSLNYLGLSARHIGLQVSDGQLQVQQLSSSSPVYILDQSSALLGRMAAGEVAEVSLPAGGQLLLGNYWLQFDGLAHV